MNGAVLRTVLELFTYYGVSVLSACLHTLPVCIPLSSPCFHVIERFMFRIPLHALHAPQSLSSLIGIYAYSTIFASFIRRSTFHTIQSFGLYLKEVLWIADGRYIEKRLLRIRFSWSCSVDNVPCSSVSLHHFQPTPECRKGPDHRVLLEGFSNKTCTVHGCNLAVHVGWYPNVYGV